MRSNLKGDQIPTKQAQNWRLNLEEEKNVTFNLDVPVITLQKETYLKLTGDDDSRIRIYLGLEPEKGNGKFVLCAYAVSAFLFGSGDVFRDYENPVYKLDKENKDYSSQSDEVLKSIRRFRKWRKGDLDKQNKWARFRTFIYPNAFLVTKYELHEIFMTQNKDVAQIEFGIAKTLNAMIYSDIQEQRSLDDQASVFDFSAPCPPYCDESSIYNSDDNISG